METISIAKDNNNRCTFKTVKGRRCLLEIHPDTTKHIMVVRQAADKKKSLSAVLPVGFSFKAENVAPADVVKKAANRRDTAPRDQDQKRIDREAKANYDKNVAKNVHAKMTFDQYVLSQYIVPPQATDVVMEYLRRAAGTGGTVHGSVLRYRKGTHNSGNIRIQWAFVKPAPKGATNAQ